jgi:hypothetical protein
MSKLKYPILFDHQKEITSARVEKLKALGLVVPDNTLHGGDRRTTNVKNPTAGEVVGYSILARKFKDGEITQELARDLLSIEAARKGGPRETHTARLLANSYGTEKINIVKKVLQWGQKQK